MGSSVDVPSFSGVLLQPTSPNSITSTKTATTILFF